MGKPEERRHTKGGELQHHEGSTYDDESRPKRLRAKARIPRDYPQRKNGGGNKLSGDEDADRDHWLAPRMC